MPMWFLPRRSIRRAKQPIAGIDSAALVDGIRARGHRHASEVSGPGELAQRLAGTLVPGDIVVCLGAGDITKWAAGLAAAVNASREPAA